MLNEFFFQIFNLDYTLNPKRNVIKNNFEVMYVSHEQNKQKLCNCYIQQYNSKLKSDYQDLFPLLLKLTDSFKNNT